MKGEHYLPQSPEEKQGIISVIAGSTERNRKKTEVRMEAEDPEIQIELQFFKNTKTCYIIGNFFHSLEIMLLQIIPNNTYNFK